MKQCTLRKIDKYLGFFLTTIFRYLSLFFGAVFRRKHDITKVTKSITVIKMLGGGSVFIALPFLHAVRNKYPDKKIVFVGQKISIEFAKLTGIFDEHIEIRTNSILELIISSAQALVKVFRTDLTIDLEIHSKMTSLFSLFSCAKNRFGFYVEINAWQKGILTHALFINDSAPINIFYQQIAYLLKAPVASPEHIYNHLITNNQFINHKTNNTVQKISLGCFSSELCSEREFSDEQWCKIIEKHHFSDLKTIVIIGGKADIIKAQKLVQYLQNRMQGISLVNYAGKLTLSQSVQAILKTDKFLTIDSGLNHIVRFLNMNIVSYWGPTSPKRLLGPSYTTEETIHYNQVFCSPCVHLVYDAPCQGNNICMQQHLEQNNQQMAKQGWAIKVEDIGR